MGGILFWASPLLKADQLCCHFYARQQQEDAHNILTGFCEPLLGAVIWTLLSLRQHTFKNCKDIYHFTEK
jgi:hypothetical protein